MFPFQSVGILTDQQKTDLNWLSSTPLMICLIYMFTAVWQYVANECRVATMQEEGEREKERDKGDRESQSEGGGEWVVFVVKH